MGVEERKLKREEKSWEQEKRNNSCGGFAPNQVAWTIVLSPDAGKNSCN